MRPNILFTTAALTLSGCIFPYAGQKPESGLPCVSMGLYMPMANGSSYSSQCQTFSKHAQRKEYLESLHADDSTKHVQYTEEQRLAMTEWAVKKLYPIEKFRFVINSVAISDLMGNGSTDYRCNTSLARREFALALGNRIPASTMYKAVAAQWSERYSDKQIAAVYDAAKITGITSALNEELAPQRGLAADWPSDMISSAQNYASNHRQSLASEANHFYEGILARHNYPAAQNCTYEMTNKPIGYYNLKKANF